MICSHTNSLELLYFHHHLNEKIKQSYLSKENIKFAIQEPKNGYVTV